MNQAKTKWPIDKLDNWKRNPRSMEDSDKERLKRQLIKLTQYKPLLIVVEDDRGIVLGGNMRLTAMRELAQEGHSDFKEVWVSIVDAPDDKAKLEYALSDNDRAGSYNNRDLVNMLEEIPTFELETYHIDTGSSNSLESIIDLYKETDEDDFDGDKEAAAIETPTSQKGNLWQLGDHRLMCGDSTNLEDIQRLTGGGKADMSFTDPPYNVDYSGRGKKTNNKILNDCMDEEQFRLFLNDTFSSYRVALKDDGPIYVCYASRTHREFEDAMNTNGFKVKNQIIWVKTVASMGWGDYRWKHEPILYATVDQKAVPFYGDRKQYTVWEQKPTDEELLAEAKRLLEESENGENDTTVWKLSRDSNYDHPTQKPLSLIEIALKNSTQKGETVIDLFGGSGSTLMACQQLERKCWSMELDPKYCDVIIKRWEQFTGLKAVMLD